MKRAAAFCCLLVGALTACEQLTGVADLEVGERKPRARTTPDPDAQETDAMTSSDAPLVVDAGQDTAPIDTGIDTKPAACTTLPTNETFPAAPGAEWTALGAAVAA